MVALVPAHRVPSGLSGIVRRICGGIFSGGSLSVEKIRGRTPPEGSPNSCNTPRTSFGIAAMTRSVGGAPTIERLRFDAPHDQPARQSAERAAERRPSPPHQARGRTPGAPISRAVGGRARNAPRCPGHCRSAPRPRRPRCPRRPTLRGGPWAPRLRSSTRMSRERCLRSSAAARRPMASSPRNRLPTQITTRRDGDADGPFDSPGCLPPSPLAPPPGSRYAPPPKRRATKSRYDAGQVRLADFLQVVANAHGGLVHRNDSAKVDGCGDHHDVRRCGADRLLEIVNLRGARSPSRAESLRLWGTSRRSLESSRWHTGAGRRSRDAPSFWAAIQPAPYAISPCVSVGRPRSTRTRFPRTSPGSSTPDGTGRPDDRDGGIQLQRHAACSLRCLARSAVSILFTTTDVGHPHVRFSG